MIDIKVEKVSKRYFIPDTNNSRGGSSVLQRLPGFKARPNEFWAVKDVDIEVSRGEALGIIGHNGAGKSTILKLLSGITAPTAGQITISGRLAALIEVGSGFHPELTGRENVFLNGSILGMRRREIAQKLDAIIEFAGIRTFVDTPVKHFSSGMYVRLGFAIAAHLDPEILLLDEVLAVGDAAFQAKCIQRINELKNGGTTIVFISHDLGAVERLCDRVVLLSHGTVIASGQPADIISKYQQMAGDAPSESSREAVTPNSGVSIVSIAYFNPAGEQTAQFQTGDAFVARVDIDTRITIDDAIVEVFFYSPDSEILCQLSTDVLNERVALEKGHVTIEFASPELGLQPGLYYADVSVKDRNTLKPLHVLSQARALRVDPGRIVKGKFYLPHECRLIRTSDPSLEIAESVDVNGTSRENMIREAAPSKR